MMLSIHFNAVDYAILGVLAFSALLSIFRGFLREAIALLAWGVGLWGSLKYAPVVEKFLTPWITVASLRYFSAFVGIFFLILFLGWAINRLMRPVIHRSGLSAVDRWLGFCFGLIRGATVVAVFLLMATHIEGMAEQLPVQHSQLAPYFRPAVVWLDRYLPDTVETVTAWLKEKSSTTSEG